MSDTSRDPDDDEPPTGDIPIGGGAGGDAAVTPAGASAAHASGPDAGGLHAGGLHAGGLHAGGLHAGGPGTGGASSGDMGGPHVGGAGAGAPGEGSPGAGSPGEGGPGVGGSGAGSLGVGGSGGSGVGDAATSATKGANPGRPSARRLLSFGPLPAGAGDPRQRRRRRWFAVGMTVAAVIVVAALCAGALSVVSAVHGMRDRAADARAARVLRENDCLQLESRLNRLVPPGSATGPAARATAIRDENAAVRIYVDQLDIQRDEDAWRQLLDARTVFADALDRQAKTRTPAFYVAPRADNGLAVADQLIQWSPAQCAGAIRRLAAPEL